MEPGFRATDKKDGDITYLVKSTGLPDPNVSGIYYVRYNVTDASGNHAKEMTRICFVSHNNISLSSIYEASETCSETSMNNENYFISIEKEDFNTNSIYLKGYNNLPQEKKIKAIIISNTGQLLTIPQQAIFDTIYSGTGKINISGTLVTLDIIKQYNIFKDSCTTILTRELQ